MTNKRRLRQHTVSADRAAYEGEPLNADYVSCPLDTVTEDRVRVELRYNPQRNCVEIRCPEGRLVLVPESANLVRVHIDTDGRDEVKL